MSSVATPVLDLGALAAYLRDHGVGLDGDLSAHLVAGGRSNLTYRVADASSQWIVRRPPGAGATPSAHDVAREVRVTRALQETGVPVARTVALCEDPSIIGAPFSVVEFVAGRTIRTQDDLARLDDHALAACMDGLIAAFVGLHRVDHEAVGLGGFGRPDAYAARQLRRWSGQWDIVSDGSSPAANQLVGMLRNTIPEQRHTSIVHGDFRIDNTLISDDDPGTVTAILDWELSTIGDPIADVAMMCAYRHPGLDLVLGTTAAWTSDRLPTAQDLAAKYESAGGVRLDDWEFYLGLSYYKLAVIAEGINHRFKAGATFGDGFDTAGESVEGFLEAGLAVASG